MSNSRSVKIQKAVDKRDSKALAKAMTVRELKFCEEYLIDFEGKAAAIRAGYAPKWADRQAHLLLQKNHIRAYIDITSQSKEAKIMSVTPDYIIQRITAIINAPEARDGDKLRGLEMLARHLGMFIDRQEITGKDGGAIEVENRRIEEEAQNFTHLLKGLRDKAKDKVVN